MKSIISVERHGFTFLEVDIPRVFGAPMSRHVYSEEVGQRKRRIMGSNQWKAYGQTLWMMRRENEVVARLDRTPSTRPCHQMMGLSNF